MGICILLQLNLLEIALLRAAHTCSLHGYDNFVLVPFVHVIHA